MITVFFFPSFFCSSPPWYSTHATNVTNGQSHYPFYAHSLKWNQKHSFFSHYFLCAFKELKFRKQISVKIQAKTTRLVK